MHKQLRGKERHRQSLHTHTNQNLSQAFCEFIIMTTEPPQKTQYVAVTRVKGGDRGVRQSER